MILQTRKKVKKNKELIITVSTRYDKYGRLSVKQDINADYPRLQLVKAAKERLEAILYYLDDVIEEAEQRAKEKKDENNKEQKEGNK